MPVNKNSKSSKPKAKEAKPAAVVKKANKAASVKAAVKVATKTAPKTVSKAASKTAPKAAPKGAVKATVKATVKTVAKAQVKVTAKAPVKVASKAVVKAVVKAPARVPAKTPAKVPAKVPNKTSVKVLEKAAPKTAAKMPVKAVVKAAVKAPTKASTKPVKTPAKPAKSVPTETPKAVPQTANLAPTDPAAAFTPDVPVRAVRPSARLAQITVPSMAQSVASTAAKASYLQNMPSEALTPPPFVAVKKDTKLANNWKTKKPDQLTDAEVMAMSDNDYMNDAQMAFFRLKLVALKVGILASAGQTTENLREDTVVVPDPADRATIEEEHALELRTRDRERKLLKKIEQSIQRIDAGDYGYCDETGEPIGVGRLLARPTANLSLEAQQRRELKQKMFGD